MNPETEIILKLVDLGASGAIVAALLIMRPILRDLIRALTGAVSQFGDTAKAVGSLEDKIDELPDAVGSAVVAAVPCGGQGDCGRTA